LPRIREIRFYTYRPFDGKDPDEELRRPRDQVRLDILLDLPVEHAAALARNAAATNVRVRWPGHGASPTRRIYFLAVNNSMPPLDYASARLGLAHAINREKLLNDYFRPKGEAATRPILGQLHAALNGPYPPGSWACNPKVGQPRLSGSLDLFDLQRARPLFLSDASKRTVPSITLKYPDDDPALAPAMQELCRQLGELPALKVQPVAVSPRQLREDIETGSYHLAYTYFDFADETYWLWPLLARRQDLNGNIFRCKPAELGPVEALFREAMQHRDFETVKQETRRIHEELYMKMFFIPLWQLDPLAAVADRVDAPPFDPLLVFSEAERWKLNDQP
jgi:ABC-type transport system substrate-binding protein